MSDYYIANDAMQPIVAEIGSFSTKMGLAGHDYPKAYFRSNVAVKRRTTKLSTTDQMRVDSDSKSSSSSKSQKKSTSSTPGGSRRQAHHQSPDQKHQQPLKGGRKPIDQVHYDYLTRPLNVKAANDDGWSVVNAIEEVTGLPMIGDDSYELIQLFLQRGFNQHLARANPTEQPFLMIERSYTPPPIRQECLELLMEEVGVPAAFLGRDATMACYACGRTTGTVVDIGHSGTVVTPVYEGYVEQKAIRISPMGANEMDHHLTKQLDRLTPKSKPFLPLYRVRDFPQRKQSFHTLARLDVARRCREEGSGVAVVISSGSGSATAHDKNNQFLAPSMAFELPDGTSVDISAKVRFGVSDLLVGMDESSIAKREELTQVREAKLKTFLDRAGTNGESREEEKDDSNKESIGVDEQQQEEYYRNVFSEAAAVGISTRRRKDTPKVPRPPFSVHHLRKASAPYLQQLNLSSSPISAMICDAAFQSDRDQQASLLGNVVLAGGGSCIGPTDAALTDLIRDQVEEIIHQHTPGWRVKVLSPNFSERSVCSWLGGSILGSLGTFHEMWITKADYEEWGSAIVNKKCP